MSERPNIVLITADQWRADTLGLLQNQHPLLTPHLDQLSDEGVRFSNAWADCPICMPQRATLLTGLTGSTLGVTTNFHDRTPVESKTSLPALLRKRGDYQCACIGKTHVIPERGRFGFDEVVLHPDDYVNFLEDRGFGGLYRGHGVGGNEVVPAPNPLPETLTSSHWITDRAIEFMYRRDPEHPFFLWIIYEAPHPPFDPPEAYQRLYSRQPIPGTTPSPWAESEEPRAFTRRRLMHNWDRLSPEWINETRRFYYAQQTFIDYQLGRLFGELKSRDLWDDTAVMFHSDHGEHLGDFGLFGKTTFMRGSGDVPLIIKPSADVSWTAGTVCNAPVQNADVPATIAEFADIGSLEGADHENPEISGRPDGLSLLNHMQKPDDPGHAERIIFGEFGGRDGSVSAVGSQYRYIYYPDGGIEHVFPAFGTDSELVEKARLDPKSLATVKDLRTRLTKWLTDRGSPAAAEGELVATEDQPIDETNARSHRSRNPMAWRGPIRYGRGYGGGY